MSLETASSAAASAPRPNALPKMTGEKVGVFYGDKQALFDVDLEIEPIQVTSLIGPSGCGKSTFLRSLNRMNDTIDGCRVTGKILLDGDDIYDPSIDVVELRARVGMVFQKPNPFPKSIYENVAYGPRSTAWRAARPSSTRSSIPRSAAPASGTRSRIASTSPAPACPVASSSASASPAPSPPSPKCC